MPCRRHGADCRGHASQARDDRAILDHDDLARLEAVCTSPEERALLLVIYDLALRSAEIADLRRDDFDLDRTTACVRRRKGGRRDVLGIARRTAESLRALPPRPRLFAAWSARRVQRWYLDLVRRAGLLAIPGDPRNKGYSHCLRRSRATHLRAAGADIKDIQRRLGHRSPATTLLYLGLTEARKREIDEIAAKMIDVLAARSG